MHADPSLRALALKNPTAAALVAARRDKIEEPWADDRPARLASVTPLPTGTPLGDVCPTVELACPARDGGRLSIGKLLSALGWVPETGRRDVAVVVDGARPVLWVHGAAPAAEPQSDCTGDACRATGSTPTERLLAGGRQLPRRGSVDLAGRLRLVRGHLAALQADEREQLVVLGLFDLGLLAVATATDVALHGALTDLTVPSA